MAISSTALIEAVSGNTTIYDLGRPLFVGMPQSPNHPQFRMALTRRHGDMVRSDGGSAAAEILVTGAHVGTHIDALAHVSQDGRLHGGIDAWAAQVGGQFMELGAHTIPPMLCRGVLLDVPGVLGLECCTPGMEITPDMLALAEERAGTSVGQGDVALIRSGWGRRFDDPEAYVGRDSGVPGVGEEGAAWLAERGVRAAGADTIAFERLAPGAGHSLLPAHRVLLVEHGIHIIETMNLEELAAAGVGAHLFVLSPLAIVGGTGSPVRPLAVVARDGEAER
jgi:kynurenine formamidase